MTTLNAYVPTNVEAIVGELKLVFDPADSSKYVAMLGEKEIEPHRKIEVILEVGKPPVVRVEYILKPWKHVPQAGSTPVPVR